jgi:hypothetical protein
MVQRGVATLPLWLELAYLAFLATLVYMAASIHSTFATAVEGSAPSREGLRAWPSLSQAAEMLGLSLSALSRAMDARKIAKHQLGGRVRKIAPVALLDLAVEYGADVAKVADEVMGIAEGSGVADSLTAAIEQDVGAWFADQAMQAPGPLEDELSAVIEAMREAIGAKAADAILARAGVRAPVSAASERHLSAR